MEKMIFYYIWRKDDSTTDKQWRYKWGNVPFHVKIFTTDQDMIGRVDMHNPRMQWVSHDTLNERRQSSWIEWIELPNLYHIPIRGKRFSELTVKPDEKIRLTVRDHGWIYTTGGDGRYIPMDYIFLENQGQPTWREMCYRGFLPDPNESTAEKQRLFCTACREMGEWKRLADVAQNVWSGEYLKYIMALVRYHTTCRFPKKQRDETLRDELCSVRWREAWARVMELSREYPEWDMRVWMIQRMHGLGYDYDDNTFEHLPSGTCVREMSLKIDCVLKDEMRILYNDVFTRCRFRYMFDNMMKTDDRQTRNDVLNAFLVWIKPLSSLDNAEKGDILYSTDNTDYVASSSSLIPYPDNRLWYVVNVRRVNYRIQENGSYISIVDGKISPHYNGITKNEFYFMDRETLQPISDTCKIREDDLPRRRPEEIAIVGIEDVRLIEYNDKIMFYGVTKSHSYSDSIRIIWGDYDIEHSAFRNARVLRPPYEENSCEKNWTWCGNGRFIYRWHPIEIGYINSDNKLVIDERIKSPGIFQEFRGSSSGIEWKGYLWFSVHSVHFINGRRKYIHYLVVMDMKSAEKSVVALSEPFYFENIQIEYTIGLDIHAGKIVFLYSTRDATSRYIRLPLMSFLSKLYFFDETRRARFFQTLLTC